MNCDFLCLFIEGDDDERLIKKIITESGRLDTEKICTYKYSQQRIDKVNDFIHSIKAIPGMDYIFFVDYDDCDCINNKKLEVTRKFQGLDQDHIVVVIKEIESWYLNGLDQNYLKKIKIHRLPTCQNLSKEMFLDCVPSRLSPYLFKLQIIENYCLEAAIENCPSIKYFINKYLLD